jgi:sulfate transport system permease protein
VLVQQKYQNFEQGTAYAISFLLAIAAVVCLVVVALLRPKDHRPTKAHKNKELA